MAVFVLDKHHKSLMPCSEKRARKLLECRRARVHKLRPFTIRLVDRLLEESMVDGVLGGVNGGLKAKNDPACKENTAASVPADTSETDA